MRDATRLRRIEFMRVPSVRTILRTSLRRVERFGKGKLVHPLNENRDSDLLVENSRAPSALATHLYVRDTVEARHFRGRYERTEEFHYAPPNSHLRFDPSRSYDADMKPTKSLPLFPTSVIGSLPRPQWVLDLVAA